MHLDKSRKYGEVWGVAPIAGARFSQDGNYFGANGELLAKPFDPANEPKPVEPTVKLVAVVEPPVAGVMPDEAPPAAKKAATKKTKGAPAKPSLEEELLKLAE